MSYKIATFYKFCDWPDYEDFRQPLLDRCIRENVLGTVLIAAEGLNGTICGEPDAVNSVLGFLSAHNPPGEIQAKFSETNAPTFRRMLVKLKNEIVTMGVDGVDPNRSVGTYVDPSDWDDLILDPNVVVVDTRNDYEVEIGTFEGATNPATKSFRDFPQWVAENAGELKGKKLALFCTGGIRCEKATSYLIDQGFEDVHHLKGGILEYLKSTPAEGSSWRGECYVFDDRITVDHGVEVGTYSKCTNCGMPIANAATGDERYEPEVSCPKCYDELTPERARRRRMRRSQLEATSN